MSPWILVGFAIKGSAVFAAAWLVTLALRRFSAAARHLVWTAAAAAVLALPLLSIGLPSWRIAAVDRILASDAGIVFRVFATYRPPDTAIVAPGAAAPVGTPAPASAALNWRRAVGWVWVAGVAMMLLQMLVAYAGVWRKRRHARPFPDGAVSDELAQALGVSRPVPVLQAERGAMPMNFGLVRPVVFLPADASEWNADRIRVVLLHELAHVRRGDVATHLLARTALALHWWNPLAWFAWREFLKERERATDDLVLSAGARASEYATHLLEVARSFHSGATTAWAAVAMARGSQLEGRLLAILDSGVRRGAVRRLAPLAAGLIAVAMVAPFAALEGQDRPQGARPPEIDATILAATSQKNHEILDRAASAYINLQKYDVAQTLLETSLKIRGEVAGEQSGSYAAGLVKLGDILEKRGQKEAKDFYERALALGDRPEVASVLFRAGLAAYPKDLPAARDFLQRAINVDPKGPKAGPAMTWLAVATNSQPGGAYEAETLFQRALAVEGPQSAEMATTLELYSNFLRFQNRLVESEPMLARAKAIRLAYIAEAFSNRSVAAIEGSAFRVGGGVAAPRLIQKVEVGYSEEARAAKHQGSVLLYVEVYPDGTAQNIRVVKSLGLGLDEKAIEAVQQWLFAPGTKDGVPVPVQAQIEVNFKLL